MQYDWASRAAGGTSKFHYCRERKSKLSSKMLHTTTTVAHGVSFLLLFSLGKCLYVLVLHRLKCSRILDFSLHQAFAMSLGIQSPSENGNGT